MGDETRQRKSGVVLQELAVKPEFRDIHAAERPGEVMATNGRVFLPDN